TRRSPRVERWLSQSMPKLDRLRSTPNLTSLRTADMSLWTEDRLKRRAKGQDLAPWLAYIQKQIDSQSYGDARRELEQVLMVYPGSPEALSMRGELQRLLPRKR